LKLCGAHLGTLVRFDGELLHMMAYHGVRKTPSGRRAPPTRCSWMRLDECAGDSGRGADQSATFWPRPDYPLKEQARQRGWRSVLAVPMLSEGEAVGALAIIREETGLFPGSWSSCCRPSPTRR
jgi:hypothetical protein